MQTRFSVPAPPPAVMLECSSDQYSGSASRTPYPAERQNGRETHILNYVKWMC